MNLDTIIQLGDPVAHRGVILCPLFPRLRPRADYLTLEQALPLGFRLTEVDEAGAVPELAVDNPLDQDVLLYDGEELLGAKQNRILNLSVLVAAESKTRIPVSCVEQGRWASRSAAFQVAPHAAHPELRRRKNVQLLAEPTARGAAQHAVWDEVRLKAASLGTASPTGAHSDTYAGAKNELDALRDAFPLQNGQCGALYATGAELCLDLVSRPEAWTRLYPKLLDGYLLDSLGRPQREPATGDALAAFVDSIGKASLRRSPSVARGEDLRLAGEGVHGSGLELEGELLQLSAFSGDASTPGVGRIARPSVRR